MIALPSPAELFGPADDAVLRLPLAQLIARSEADLARRDLFRDAGRSSLYRKRWAAAGVKAEALAGRDGLRRLPFITGADLLEIAATGRSLNAALLARPRIWVTSRSAGETKKWLPLTLADVAHWFSRVRRCNEMLGIGIGRESLACVLAINEPMPAVSNAVPYLWERADFLAGGSRLEFIIAAMEMRPRNHWDRFAVGKQPQWLMASVADARALAAALGPGQRFTALRRGFFWGAALDGPVAARAELAAAYGLTEAFSLYFSAECREMYAECPAHAGLHLWLDAALHEIIPDGAATAQFVDEVPAGTEGEYVVTTLGEALPLVRYRTGDRIRVVSAAACACGITHPRVLFLGKTTGA